MALGLFFFGANIVALTANLLTGAGLLISNPRSVNARIFAGVTVSAACYVVGRLSYAVPADVQVTFYLWPFLLTFMNLGTGFWMILAYSLFQDEQTHPALDDRGVRGARLCSAPSTHSVTWVATTACCNPRRTPPSSTSFSDRCRSRCSPRSRCSRCTGPRAAGARTSTKAGDCCADCSWLSSVGSRSAST